MAAAVWRGLSIFPVICSTNLSLAGAAPPSLRARVVGDDRQLTHISNLGADSDDRLMVSAGISAADTRYHRHSAFDRARAVTGQSAFTLLDRHYRCVPAIIAFCNGHFYGGQLKVERPAGDGEALAGGLPRYGFRLDDIPAGETRYRASSASKSALNTREAQRVIGLVVAVYQSGCDRYRRGHPLPGAASLAGAIPAQVAGTEADVAVRAAVEQVEIGTIHMFQGGQHQLMLFSTVVAQGARSGTVRWFEDNRNLLNVAISRAGIC